MEALHVKFGEPTFRSASGIAPVAVDFLGGNWQED